MRGPVKEMRENGMKWSEIATEIALSESHVRNIWAYSQRLEKQAEVAAKTGEPAPG
jgi:orotate phosphoribosyltransferase-like protein